MRRLLAILCCIALIPSPALAAPSNDAFGDAANIPEIPFDVTVSNVGASLEPHEPQPCGSVDHSVWYRLDATGSGRLVGRTTDSDGNVVAAAYTGTTLEDLVPLGCSSPEGIPSSLTFDVVSGTTYFVQLGHAYPTGPGTIRFRLEPESRIEGTVRRADGHPLPDACVDAYDAQRRRVQQTVSTSDGGYRLQGLYAEEYRIHFAECTPTVYAPEWYDDMRDFASASVVALASGATATGVDATLEVGGSISGTLFDERTGEPAEGVCVLVGNEDGSTYRSANSSADGVYALAGLAAGSHTLEFDPACATAEPRFHREWYLDKPDRASADPVMVQLGVATIGIDAHLSSTVGTGSITGVVTDAGGAPVEGVCVGAFVIDWTTVKQVQTDAAGRYTLDGLGRGSYGVRFGACGDGTPVTSVWYQNKPSYETADPVAVEEGVATPDVNAVVEILPHGTISGTVTSADHGIPVKNVCVQTHDGTGLGGFGARTGPDGRYRIRGVTPGTYRISFVDCIYRSLEPEWYDDKLDYDAADPIVVLDGVEVTGVDAALSGEVTPPSGFITGTVRDDRGEPAAVCVSVFDLEGNPIASDQAFGRTGGYYFRRIPPGSYKVRFTECGTDRYEVWFNQKMSFDAADLVNVTEAEVTEGIDAVVPSPTGRVYGAVRDVHGQIVEACVGVHALDGTLVTQATTVLGDYSLDSVTIGEYKVRFSSCHTDTFGFWFDQEPDFDDAATVLVERDQSVGVNAVVQDPPDLGIGEIEVTTLSPAPEVPVDPGWMRRIDVTVGNRGIADVAGARLTVRACPTFIETLPPLANCQQIRDALVDVPALGNITVPVDWDAAGWVGRVRIVASIDFEPDTYTPNDSGSVEHTVVTETFGGVRVPPP